MNAQILNKYGFNFIKRADGERIISNMGTSYIAAYIWECNDPELIDEYISDINLCLSGQYELVEEPDKSSSTIYARLYPNGLYFDENDKLPLEDLKELLLSWKEFLENN